MNFLKDYEQNRELEKVYKEKKRKEIEEQIRSDIFAFKIPMAESLKKTSRAELKLKDLGAAGFFARKELGQYIADTVASALKSMFVQCDVHFKTQMTEIGLDEIIVSYSLYPMKGGEKHCRRYKYNYITKKSEDISANIPKPLYNYTNVAQ